MPVHQSPIYPLLIDGRSWARPVLGAGGSSRRADKAEHHLWGCSLEEVGLSFITSFSSRALPSWAAWKPSDPAGGS